MDSSDILPFSDGNGELYLGRTRSASWKRLGPGRTLVTLSQKVHGKESAQEGIVQQGEKAPGICRHFVETGECTYAFFPVEGK